MRAFVLTIVAGLLLFFYFNVSAQAKNSTIPEPDKFYILCATGSAEEIEAAIKSGKAVDSPAPGIAYTEGEHSVYVDKGDTPAHTACRYNTNTKAVLAILAEVKDVNIVNSDNETLLMQAALNQTDEAVVDYLLKRGAKVDVREKNTNSTALFYAAGNPNPEITRLLLEAGANPNSIVLGNNSILHQTSYARHAELLLAAGAELNAENKDYKFTPLHSAACCSPSVIPVLLAAGADVNRRDSNGNTALMQAVMYGPMESVSIILAEKGVDLEAKDNEGNTAFMLAQTRPSRKGDELEIIRLLIDSGANVQTSNNKGDGVLFTAIHIHPNYFEDIPDLNQVERIEILVAAGADVNAKNKDGSTPLHKAAAGAGNMEVLHTLIKYGAVVNAKDKYGYTPLDYAYEPRSPDLARAYEMGIMKDVPPLPMSVVESQRPRIAILKAAGATADVEWERVYPDK